MSIFWRITLIYQEKLAYEQCFTTEGQSVSYFNSLCCNELHFQSETFVLASMAIILLYLVEYFRYFHKLQKKYMAVIRITFNE